MTVEISLFKKATREKKLFITRQGRKMIIWEAQILFVNLNQTFPIIIYFEKSKWILFERQIKVIADYEK